MLMDNASYHHAAYVHKMIAQKKLPIELLYSVPYRPDYNGQEVIWAIVKQRIRKQLMQQLQEKKVDPLVELIERNM